MAFLKGKIRTQSKATEGVGREELERRFGFCKEKAQFDKVST